MANAFIVIVLIFPIFANAQVVLTEVMYDLAEGSDSGREWVEVFNTGVSPIDLSKWRLFENGVNHKITALGSAVLAPGTYAVIADNPAKFKADWAQYSGLLFDSAFSLSNDGETIVLRSGIEGIDTAAFVKTDGGNGTGDSLQRDSAGATFEAGMPTPGAGIPVEGLQKSPPKQAVATKKSAAVHSVSAPPVVIGVRESSAAVPSEALPAKQASALWWLSPLVFAAGGSVGIVWARHLRKDEWEIIEEVDETG